MKIFSVTLTTSLLLITLVGESRGQAQSDTPQLGARVDAIFAPYARADAPGCAVSIAKRGKILYANGYGLADVSHNIRFSPQTPVIVASTSKPFTALAVLLL